MGERRANPPAECEGSLSLIRVRSLSGNFSIVGGPCSCRTRNVVTVKGIRLCHDSLRPKKAKRRKARSRRGKVIELRASVEDDLLSLAEEERGAEARWNRPRKRRISLRVDTEVVDWFKSKGPGYQTRINRILRRVMVEGKKRAGEG